MVTRTDHRTLCSFLAASMQQDTPSLLLSTEPLSVNRLPAVLGKHEQALGRTFPITLQPPAPTEPYFLSPDEKIVAQTLMAFRFPLSLLLLISSVSVPAFKSFRVRRVLLVWNCCCFERLLNTLPIKVFAG